jgi:hypothetical protein
MNVKEAVEIAKKSTSELFDTESLINLGLEEVEFEEGNDVWCITLGFSRPWDSQSDFISAIAKGTQPKRSYKIIRISDLDGRVLSVRNRDALVS